MKDKIRIAAGIGILLIALALIVTPVAAVNTPWKITPATKNIYNSHTPPVKINNPNFHITPGITTGISHNSNADFGDRWATMIGGSTCSSCGCSGALFF